MITPENGKNLNTKIDLTPDEQAFVERMKSAYQSSVTEGDRLRALYENGDTDTLDDELDDIAHTLAMQGVEYKKTFQKLQAVRSVKGSKEQERIHIDRLAEIRSYYRQIIINETGLPDEARFTEIENARNSVNELLDGIPEESKDADSALIALNIKKINSQAEEIDYIFPVGLVPASVKDKWETYLATVCKHLQLADQLNGSDRYQSEVGRADKARKFAHDAITTDLHAILGFGERYGWEFIDTRKLVAAMRETAFPTRAAALGEKAKNIIAAHGDYVSAATLLCDHHR